jgi:hypothetical protein
MRRDKINLSATNWNRGDEGENDSDIEFWMTWRLKLEEYRAGMKVSWMPN